MDSQKISSRNIFLYNNRLKRRARFLRVRQTDAETNLWYKLKSKQLGYKFRRQHPIDKYILDFYCSEKKLGIELDGGQHATEINIHYDQRRTVILSSYGIKILRFWDNDVFQNINGVLEEILRHLQAKRTSPSPLLQGEGIFT